jgi:hypothetical protein
VAGAVFVASVPGLEGAPGALADGAAARLRELPEPAGEVAGRAALRPPCAAGGKSAGPALAEGASDVTDGTKERRSTAGAALEGAPGTSWVAAPLDTGAGVARESSA